MTKAEEIIKELKKLFPNVKIALNYKTPLELLIAVIMSAQAQDKQVNIITADLFRKYKTIKDYVNAPLSEFENDIKRIGLYRAKAKNIKATVEIIYKEYNGKVPDSMEELLKLPGVGRKTANVVLYCIYRKTEGIAIDTHARRLSQLFGLSNTDDVVKIERDLMEIVPRKDWGEITYLFAEYGRTYCTAFCKHTSCPLKNSIV
ncbi:MAG: endonuclease III [Nanoarchaeota archaeon]|nr:endonuclease III [Nanoarchaeota archaeon]